MYSICKWRRVTAAPTHHYSEYVLCVCAHECALRSKYRLEISIRGCLTTEPVIKSMSSLHWGLLRIKTREMVNEQEITEENESEMNVFRKENVFGLPREKEGFLPVLKARTKGKKKSHGCFLGPTVQKQHTAYVSIKIQKNLKLPQHQSKFHCESSGPLCRLTPSCMSTTVFCEIKNNEFWFHTPLCTLIGRGV